MKLKIVSMALAKKLLKHPSLKMKFKTTKKRIRQSDDITIHTVDYLGWAIEIKCNKYITFIGSLHKYYTGGFNYTDFGYSDVCSAIDMLCSEFYLDISTVKIEWFEIGVNVELAISAIEFIRAIRCFDLMPFSYEQPIAINQHVGKIFSRTQYLVKCYSKSLNARLKSHNLLRFEAKFKKMELVKHLGIYSLEDLVCHSKFVLLSQEILNYYDRIHLWEPTLDIQSVLKRNERELLINGRDAQFWDDLSGTITKQAIHQKRAKYKRLMMEYSPANLKADILKLIQSKIQTLCNG